MTFQPSVGREFAKTQNNISGIKLLVLGESHYSKDRTFIGTCEPGFTRQVVQDHPISGKSQRFFDNVARAALWKDGQPLTRDEIRAFWDSILFCNYVPVVVDGNSRQKGGQAKRPTLAQFKAGADPFRRVQQEYQPSAVLVCGLELWEQMAVDLNGFEEPARDVIFYDDGRSLFAQIHHPSYVRFQPRYWKPRIDFLLEQAREPRVRGRKMLWKDWTSRQFS